MEIRSVTFFCEPDVEPELLRPLLTAVRTAFPYPVQTTRLATPPFPDWWPEVAAEAAADEEAHGETGRQVAARWQAVGIDYLSLGPVQRRHDPAWLAVLPAILAATEVVFASVEIVDQAGVLDVDRCRRMARLVQQVSRIQPHGFGNLYLTAVANCPAGSPFFPVAYHQGGPSHFALAVEAADLALTAVSRSHSLAEARQKLVAEIEAAAATLTAVADSLAGTHGLRFSGIDFSLAPYPTADKSLGGALEALGVPHVGAAGSLFAAGFVAEAIARARFPRCGFSGLMLPVLEDATLARRAAEGVLTVPDLLGFSAVCGVGLDTIPLPGAVTEAQLTAVYLDLGMLAARLNKPLTARLMPLPGRAAGDPVRFDFPYFADSRVMEITGAGSGHLLDDPASLPIRPISA